MIRSLIFDLGGVVIPFDFRRGYAAMEARCPHPAAEIPKRIRATGLVHRFETGQIDARSFVAELCRALDLNVSFEDFCELWSAIFLPGSLIPESMLRDLGSRYRLIALSNTNDLHFREIEAKYPIIRHFHDLVLSYRVGCAKPDRRIYDEAVARAGCAPRKCLFIDDVAAYVDGARAAGIAAVQFESLAQLQFELQTRGIL